MEIRCYHVARWQDGILILPPSSSIIIADFTQTLWQGMEVGDTKTVSGIFKLMAAFRIIRQWSVSVLWPWYVKYLPYIPAREGNIL